MLENLAWSALQGIIAAIPIALSLAAFWNVRRLNLARVNEAVSRAHLSLNVSLAAKVLHHKDQILIESVVTVHNHTNKIWCVAAAYISARSFTAASERSPNAGKETYEQLATCGSISAIRNIARRSHTIVDLTPGETESFVRYDLMPASFALQHPFIVFNAEVFAADAALTNSPMRERWLEMLDRKDLEGGNTYIGLRRFASGDNIPSGFKVGDRFIATVESGIVRVDEESTAMFKNFLTDYWKIVQWTRYCALGLTTKGAD